MANLTRRGSGGIPARLALRIAKARLVELADAKARGKLGPGELRQDAWGLVAAVLARPRLDRTWLMAARMVVDRTDPVAPLEPTGPGPVTLTIVYEQARSARLQPRRVKPPSSAAIGSRSGGVPFSVENRERSFR